MIQYSFIIPVKAINDYIKEAIPKILEIKRDDYEIIIYPDEITQDSWPKARQIASGPGGPAMKRDLSLKGAQGEILIFIDDDAYPEKNFLDVLDNDFKNQDIVAVGGPAITPVHDSFWQKVSGAVFLSRWSGGAPERYRSVGKKKFVDDWPSVNFSVRKDAFKTVGGFNCEYWPGEDTKLCLDLISKTNKKILYDPNLIVYHHRREGLLRHLKQVGGYGIHRGFFAKKYPATSLKFKYFIPSLFFLAFFSGIFFSIWFELVRQLFLLLLVGYFGIISLAIIDIIRQEKDWHLALNTSYYIILTHLIYGARFIQGFIFTKQLKSRFR